MNEAPDTESSGERNPKIIAEILAGFQVKPFKVGEFYAFAHLRKVPQSELEGIFGNGITTEMEKALSEGKKGIISDSEYGFRLIVKEDEPANSTAEKTFVIALTPYEMDGLLFSDSELRSYGKVPQKYHDRLQLNSIHTMYLMLKALNYPIDGNMETAWMQNIEGSPTALDDGTRGYRIKSFLPGMEKLVSKRLNEICREKGVDSISFPVYRFLYGNGEVYPYSLEYRIVYYAGEKLPHTSYKEGNAFLVPTVFAKDPGQSMDSRINTVNQPKALDIQEVNIGGLPFQLPVLMRMNEFLLNAAFIAINKGGVQFDGGIFERLRLSQSESAKAIEAGHFLSI